MKYLPQEQMPGTYPILNNSVMHRLIEIFLNYNSAYSNGYLSVELHFNNLMGYLLKAKTSQNKQKVEFSFDKC